MTADVDVPDWVREYYELVDANDFAGCAQRFADDIEVQFGSRPVAHGKQAAGQTLAAAHEPWTSVSHHIRDLWEVDGATLIAFAATYDLKAGGTRTIPTFTVLRRRAERISQLHVYIDEASLLVDSGQRRAGNGSPSSHARPSA
jgi:ketosteroid isomerase-like protein